jgi:hypothetical protein
MTYKNMFSDSGHISIPPILALHDSKITSPGDLEKIELLCKQVHELDLTKNSITDWEQVTKLNVHYISVATMLNDWFYCSKTLNYLAFQSFDFEHS